MKNPKMEALLKKHATALESLGRELAMNFSWPARDIISLACSEMGITEKQWRALKSYQIEQEQAQ